MKISVAVLTLPGERSASVAEIVAQVPEVQVVLGNRDTSVWDSARRAWLDTPADCDWRIVLHDDAQPCAAFLRHAEAALAACGGDVVSFYGTRPEIAQVWREQIRGFACFDTFCWGTALAVRGSLVREFVAWCDEHVDPKWIMDDTRLALWCAATGRAVWCTAPSLVQHRPDLVSLARPGQHNRDSQAETFQPTGLDPRIPWPRAGRSFLGDRHSFLRSRSMHLTKTPALLLEA